MTLLRYRLRISAHRLEIERGRYNQTPVELRHCPWCKLVLNSEVTEDETHFLQHCDLNAVIRHRTLQKIISFTQNYETSPSSSQHATITSNTNFLQLINNDSSLQSQSPAITKNTCTELLQSLLWRALTTEANSSKVKLLEPYLRTFSTRSPHFTINFSIKLKPLVNSLTASIENTSGCIDIGCGNCGIFI